VISNPLRDQLIIDHLGKEIELTNDQKKDPVVKKIVLNYFKAKKLDFVFHLVGDLKYLNYPMVKFMYSTPPQRTKMECTEFFKREANFTQDNLNKLRSKIKPYYPGLVFAEIVDPKNFCVQM